MECLVGRGGLGSADGHPDRPRGSMSLAVVWAKQKKKDVSETMRFTNASVGSKISKEHDLVLVHHCWSSDS